MGPDVLADLTLVAIAIPEQMATAGLVGVPAVVRLDAFVVGSLVFALAGRNRLLSVGADSTIAPIRAAGVAGIAVAGTDRYAELMPVLALLVGGLVAAVGPAADGMDLGVSLDPAVTGVLAGISVQIVVHQLPAVLGVLGGGTTTVGPVRAVASQLGTMHAAAAVIAVAVLLVVVLAQRVDHRFPEALLGVVGSIVCVRVFGLRQHGVDVLGTVRGGLPSLGVHGASWADLGRLIAPALTVTFVCVVQTAVVERRAAHSAPADDLDRDLVVIGASSAVAGLCGAFAVNASPPRTEVTRASGGRTQVTGLVAAAAVFIVVLVATAVLDNLPQATLGGILVVVASRLFRPRELLAVLRFDRLEFAIALIALAVVAVFGIERGAWSRCSFRSPSGPASRPGPATPCWDASQGPTEGPHRYRPRDRTGARHPRLSALRPALVRQRCRALAVPQPAGGEPAAGARVRSGRERHV